MSVISEKTMQAANQNLSDRDVVVGLMWDVLVQADWDDLITITDAKKCLLSLYNVIGVRKREE